MKRIISAFVLALALSGPTFADDNAAATIAELNERLAVMSAEIRLLEGQVQLAKKQAELKKMNSSSSSQEDDAPLPSLKSIEGVNGSMYATLTHSEGGLITVEKGERLSGGWIVESIQPKSVTLVKGGIREYLTLRSMRTAVTVPTTPTNQTAR